MPINKIIESGGEYLPFALAQERKLRAIGLPYISKAYEIGDVSISVRLEGEHSFIRIRRAGGGYVVAVESDDDGEVEDSLLFDIRERTDDVPPYKRKDQKYKHYETNYWVGGSDKKLKVSHTTGVHRKYVLNAGAPKIWTGPEMLLKVFYNEACGKWIYAEQSTPTGGVGITLYAQNSDTGEIENIGVLAVTGDARMTGEDLSWTDASPDGSKVMFVWREVDPLLGFTTKKFVREHAITKWTDAATQLPVVNLVPTDTDVSDVGAGSLNDGGWGTTTSTTKSFFGYGWDGTLRYATMVYTYSHPPEPPSDSSIFDELGYYPAGTYDSTYSPITIERQVYVGGTLIASARVVGSGSVSKTIISGSWVARSAVAAANRSGDDIALKYFDARSGAYVLFRNRISVSESLVSTLDTDNQFVLYNAVLSENGSLGPTTVELNMGGVEKVWEVLAQSGVSSSVSVNTQNPYLGFSPVVNMALAGYARMRLASRKQGEAVFGLQVANAKLFAVIGADAAGTPSFLSEDTSGLKTHGKTGIRVTNIYPI